MGEKKKGLINLENNPQLQLLDHICCELDKADVNTYQQTVQSALMNRAVVEGNELIVFGSYNYAGLNNDPRINEAAKNAVDKFGTGTGGVWILGGYNEIHKKLESEIADFVNKDRAVIFGSGFTTNVSIITALFGQGSKDRDAIFYDNYAHHSIQEGIQLASHFGAARFRFAHNDMAQLESLLEQNSRYKRKIIIVDSVYSMLGDIVPMPEVLALAAKYDSAVMTDEAHAIGVIGKTGRGIQEYYGLKKDEIEIVMGTFSKTIPSTGGFAAVNERLAEYFENGCNQRVFTASSTPANTAAALEGVRILKEEGEQRVAKLRTNIDHYIDEMTAAGFNLLNSPTFRTAVIPILVKDENKVMQFSKMAQERGVFIHPIRFPAVPMGQALMRSCVMASHTHSDIETAVRVFKEIGKELAII
ncbi:MAG TPA: aminotransferase class I/II-fold pyridoxal phosphate-dependent enzyme [bacterium]|nr:aminotransferase class I/II-fold pyridoxal phosphate-dependent enzyme [bacterium]